jgi:hypothetical protein
MYSIRKQGDTVQTYVMEVVADYLKDIDMLPSKKWGPGSTCFVIEDASNWVLGSDFIWHPVLGGGTGGVSDEVLNEAIAKAVAESKLYTDTAIQDIKQFNVILVDTLPVENIQANAIYFVPMSSSEENNGYFEYIAKNDKFKIKLSSIKDYTYMKSIDGFYTLSINQNISQNKDINLTKGVIKKVAKVSNKELKYIENNNIVTLKEDINERFKEFKKSLIENIDKIICGIIGVIISGLCILGYNLLDNVYLSILMCVICYITTSIQIFLFYTDDFITRKTRLIISCGAPLLFELIFLLVCWLLFKEVFLFIDILLYSIYILPAFLVVFIIILIIICGLGYM